MELHPTKGWRGTGLGPRKNRRVKVPAHRQAEKQAYEPPARPAVKYWTPSTEQLERMALRHIHPRHKRPALAK